jgi:hypothetical protein
VVTLHAILYLVRPDKNDKMNWGNTIVKLPAHVDVSLWLVPGGGKKPRDLGIYTHNSNSVSTVCVREMMWRGVGVSLWLIAESQQQVLRNVSAVVLKRCNSNAAVAQARPEEWSYAKPFEDIPGPKPLPIIGNTWRFIPYLGNVTFCFLTHLNDNKSSENKQQK